MWHLKMKAKLSTIAGLQVRYSNMCLYNCKNGLIIYFLFTDDLTFMFEIKIFILKIK